MLLFSDTRITFIYILEVVQILVHSLKLWFSKLNATEKMSQKITEMAVELINIHLISVQQKRKL